MISNRRFIWNGYLASPIKDIKKYNSNDFFYHIEVGGNENPELDAKSDHTYIADGISVHNCSVKWSDCSICGNKAVTEKDYCSHIKNHKAKKLGGKDVYEKNHGIKFIELSAVTDGACENCTIQNVYTGKELLEQLTNLVSENQSKLVTASKNDIFSPQNISSLVKELKASHIHSLLATAHIQVSFAACKAFNHTPNSAESIV